MQKAVGGAVRRIFVKVFGFNDAERHALNAVFRLSESRPVAYALWSVDAPEQAQVALLDGDSWEAAIELANPEHDSLRLVWIGDRPSSKAWLAFSRPLQWAAVIQGLDSVYVPLLVAPVQPTAALAPDPDADQQGYADVTTAPMALEPGQAQDKPPRVLIVDADRDTRLYLRAKLATAGFMLIDEAAMGAQALELARVHVYRLAVVDLDLEDMSGWTLISRLKVSVPPLAHLIVTSEGLAPLDAARARFAGAAGALRKPLHPGKLGHLLAKAKKQNA